MKRQYLLLLLIILLLAVSPYSKSIRIPTGNAGTMEYSVLVRSPINGDAIDGPARQAVISGRYKCAYDWDGNIFLFDVYGLQLMRIDKNGSCRIIAGNGDVGHRDGLGDQATFTIGRSAYRDIYFDIVCDGYGSVYVKDNPYVRKVYQNSDSTWSVTTIFGFGTMVPPKGRWISVAQANGFKGTQSFDVNAEGTEIWFNDQYMGLIRVCLDKDSVTCLATPQEILTAGGIASFSEPPGKCKITLDSMFYFMIDRSTSWLTYNLKDGRIEHFAGIAPTARGIDNTWRLDAKWFATSPWHSIDGSVHFSSGEDEINLRRIYRDTVKHLLTSGAWNRQNSVTNAWVIAGIKGIGTDGGIYCIPGQYQWPFALCKLVSDEYQTVELPVLSHKTRTESIKRTAATLNLRICPNPLNTTATISFSLLDSKSSVVVGIYGVDGRLIKGLINATIKSGTHAVAWNGQDESGKPVTNGLYCIRIKVGSMLNTVKIVCLK